MANRHGRKIDTTHLSVDQAEERGFLHRDYLAHCLRWSHVVKLAIQLQNKKRKSGANLQVLDVGCGLEMPLARVLYVNKVRADYVGVDYGEIDASFFDGKEPGNFTWHAMAKTDFAKIAEDYSEITANEWDVIACLEMLEHVEPHHALAILQCIRSVANEGTQIVLSTPVYDPCVGAADNHVNEMTIRALHRLILLAGLVPEMRWGTFASQKDYLPQLRQEDRQFSGGLEQTWNRLAEYYDSNLVSILWAPLYPDQSRNNLWRVRVARDRAETRAWLMDHLKAYGVLGRDRMGPMGSSRDWVRAVRAEEAVLAALDLTEAPGAKE